MIKVKDGYAKLVGTTASGSASHILLSNGGVKAVSDFASAFNVKLWGQDFDGSSDVNGNMTGVGDITMSGSINSVLKATTSQGAAMLNIAEVTADINYIHLYVSSLNSAYTTTRPLVLQNGYGNVGIGTPTPGYKLHVAGTTFSTGFVKSESSDSYVLLGGGGHKLESNLSVNYAASTGNADTVDGYHASGLVKFYLSPMDSGATASSAKTWFTGTMPSSSGAIVYNVPGAEKTIIAGKSSGAFGHMLQLNYDDTYLRILRYYSGTWKSTDWEKISAGYADSAGYASSAGSATNASYYTLGPSSTFTNVWDCNKPDRIVYSDYGSSGRSVANAPSSWEYGTLLELGHMNYRGQNSSLNMQLMWDVAHGTTNGGTLWFRGNCSTYKWAKNWCKVLSDQNYSSYALPLSGGWMNKDATIYFKNPAGGTSPYAGIGYRTSVNGTMHCTSAANASGAFYIFSNGYDSANDFGGIAIDNEGVTVFGAGDSGNNFTGVFRVLNEDNPADGPQFIVTKASGATVKYNMYAAHFYENSDIRYKTIINNLAIKANQLANLPLFDFKWQDNEDQLNTGTSAQAVQELLPYIVSGTDKLTLDYGVLGTIAGITACKELTEQEKEINKLKEQIKFLKDEINNLKTNKLWQS